MSTLQKILQRVEPSPSQASTGIAVREFRKRLRLTQVQLAAASGVGTTYISELENGRRNPTLDVLTRIAAALRIRTSHLLAVAENRDRGR